MDVNYADELSPPPPPTIPPHTSFTTAPRRLDVHALFLQMNSASSWIVETMEAAAVAIACAPTDIWGLAAKWKWLLKKKGLMMQSQPSRQSWKNRPNQVSDRFPLPGPTHSKAALSPDKPTHHHSSSPLHPDCIDVAPASFGGANCATWEANGWCGPYGNSYFNVDGVSASDGCCGCGGGVALGCFDVSPASFGGSDCAAWEANGWCAPYGSSYFNSDGVSASDGCCSCGGGEWLPLSSGKARPCVWKYIFGGEIRCSFEFDILNMPTTPLYILQQ